MRRVQLDRVLKSIDCLGILLNLRIGTTQKIPGVSIVGINLGDTAKRVDRILRVTGIFVKQSQVVPGVRVFRTLLNHFLQQLAGLVDFAEVQKCHAFIQLNDQQLWVGGSGFLKGLQSFLEKLLVHVCLADSVEADGLTALWGIESNSDQRDYRENNTAKSKERRSKHEIRNLNTEP